MEEMAAYYHQPPQPIHNPHYPYYPPPPQAPTTALPPHPQQYQPQPFSSYALPPPPPPPQPSQDEVRTLFIAGLPSDTKAREIYCLFREFPGYQSSQLRNSAQSSQAFGFAVFSDQQSAVSAMHALNGMVFDLEKEATLHIDLAKSNSRSKRPRTDDGRPNSMDKKIKGSAAFSRGHTDTGVGSSFHMPGMGNSAYNMNGYPPTQSYGNLNEAVNDMNPMKLVNKTPKDFQSEQNKSSTPYERRSSNPCPTLFVANLGPTCSEKELNQVFVRCPGFLKVKMQNKHGVPVAFVDFQDVACSTGALNYLQGTFLQSSVGEGMRLEFAKSRMGMRRRERT